MAEWNQREPELFALPLEAKGSKIGRVSDWPPYVRLDGVAWSDVQEQLDSGSIYIQNPGARLAPEALAKQFKGGRILDLCAAPGGKSIYLDRRLGNELEEIVAMDLPGPRMKRFKDNVSQFGSRRIRVVESDLFEATVECLGSFEAVFLDAPCSNTGVMQRKTDAKWRIQETDITELVLLQERMLEQASRFVAQGGVLVYSTCSIDPEENEGVRRRFLESARGAGFELVGESLSLPWITKHDGAGAQVFIRTP